MKIKAFDIFDIEATPEEFVTLVKSLNKDEVKRIEALRDETPDEGTRPTAQQVELPLDVPQERDTWKKGWKLGVSDSGMPRMMRPVDMVDRNGKVVKTYPSVTKAAKAAGFRDSSIMTKSIKEKRRFGGFWYRYHEEMA